MNRNLVAGAAALALLLPCVGLAVSTNPDTPTTLKGNVIIGHMHQADGQTFDNYYTFRAGPGAVRVRVTLNAGTNAGDVEVSLTDPSGATLSPTSCGNCNGGAVIATGQGEQTTTGSFAFPAAKTVVMQVHGRVGYYHPGSYPSYRITLDGTVGLDKTAKPLDVVNR